MNSLINKVILLGIAISILISLKTYFVIEYVITEAKAKEITKSILLYKFISKKPTEEEIKLYLKKKQLLKIEKNIMLLIAEKAKYLIETPIYREVFQSGDIKLYIYENYYYYALNVNNHSYYFMHLEKAGNTITYIFIGVSFLLFIFLSISLYIIKAIQPLKDLHKKIYMFANKEQVFDNKHFAKNIDEVSEVSIAFDDATKKIQSLEEIRTLFWHNVMHELKTPITQGLLLAHITKIEKEDKKNLIQIFQKMQIQLDKLKQIEYLKSDSINFDFNRVFMSDIIEDIQDSCKISSDSFYYKNNNVLYNLNIEYFAVALKNLILNAITYSKSKKVSLVHKKDTLYIINDGGKLPKKFSYYTQAFTRAEQRESGMGLGLYISKEIFAKHKIPLRYKYYKKNHLIILNLKNIVIS